MALVSYELVVLLINVYPTRRNWFTSSDWHIGNGHTAYLRYERRVPKVFPRLIVEVRG
jgi:hypothetical protein